MCEIIVRKYQADMPFASFNDFKQYNDSLHSSECMLLKNFDNSVCVYSFDGSNYSDKINTKIINMNIELIICKSVDRNKINNNQDNKLILDK